MEATELASPSGRSFGQRLSSPFREIVDALVPRQLALSLVVPMMIFWVAATVALGLDRGYGLELLGVVGLLASRAAYRAGVREGESREAFRCSQRHLVEFRRHVLEGESDSSLWSEDSKIL